VDTLRVRLRVRGHVQGVWFRGSACEEARRLRVAGWARNLADGSVEVVAQGPRAAVELLVAWCHHGPSAARVTGVNRSEEIPREEPADFRVL